MAGLKQVVLSMVAVFIAAGIFASMVLYSIRVIRAAETQLLTGQYGVITEANTD